LFHVLSVDVSAVQRAGVPCFSPFYTSRTVPNRESTSSLQVAMLPALASTVRFRSQPCGNAQSFIGTLSCRPASGSSR
jgi:hypothetical protein